MWARLSARLYLHICDVVETGLHGLELDGEHEVPGVGLAQLAHQAVGLAPVEVGALLWLHGDGGHRRGGADAVQALAVVEDPDALEHGGDVDGGWLGARQ